MKNKTDLLFILLQIFSWSIFVGLSIDTGGYLTNAVYTLFFNPNFASHFWTGLDLSELYRAGVPYFTLTTLLLISISLMKSVLFYQIINLFQKKKLNLFSPFNAYMGRSIFNMAYLVLAIGILVYSGAEVIRWLMTLGIKMPLLQELKFVGADVWLFMGITLLIFAKIFEKGIELQSENELTV